MWRKFIRQLMISIGVIRRPDFVATIMAHHPTPDDLSAGVLVIVKDGDRTKWACFRCPGGCGEKLQLSLNPSRRPRWLTSLDWLLRPTVTPSINQLNDCRCHFWIKNGMVEWCADSGKKNTI